MAVYGISYYGDSTYGHDVKVDFDASPLVAEAEGYDRISLTWKSPKGDWDTLRVLRNWNGFSVDEYDGDRIAEFTGPTASAIDSRVRPGAWHYYTIWVKQAGEWSRAAMASTLMYADNGYAERLFDTLPVYHRFTQGAIDDLPPIENETLKQFLSVLAIGLDYIKSYYDNLRVLNDPMKNHLEQLVRLGEQFGIEYLPVTPSALYRSRVLNAGQLARSKGTMEHLQSVIGMTVGWDIEASPGPNLMLNEDSASFVHPIMPPWDAAANYATGERISYGGFVYQTNVGGAYGEAQKPTGSSTSNTWWTWLNNQVDQTFTDPDGTVAGWGAKSYTAGVTTGTFANAIGVGMQSATDPSVQTANQLILRNNSANAATADLGVLSVGAADVDPINAVKRGVPVPKVNRVWLATKEYAQGDLVLYKSLPYRALSTNKNLAPTGTLADSSVWQCLGNDDRLRLTGSVYTSGGSNPVGTTRLVYPLMEFFDDRGALMFSLDGGTDYSTTVFDSFTSRPGGVNTRTTDAGGKTWTTLNNWGVGNAGTAYADAMTAGALAYFDTTADGNVSGTFVTEAYGTRRQALAMRWVGSSFATASYLKATRTGLYSVTNGTATLLGTYSTAFSDNDRISVNLTGTTIKVYRNNGLVLTATSSTNSTSTRHGMVVV